ncbi:Rhamnosyl O-methyltransferase precursor [Synechococcus sp. MIT S9509]|uniref:CmcI family methyltransferase n=1 Tax=unclassified Synechococcus TaxID=2626047 RepID=UPI0007BB0B35|nr:MULTISPECIES: CmcI family methyltransferase [unclassified Synechococcus]KZR84407.1 Rhamnosyl O-methyltransferase precursor [Synechococcus sp. MIT S9504]KZR90763.1 Rhamnosyl O-methyltransferase precursor [Synechococcus sp. MIT S9509]
MTDLITIQELSAAGRHQECLQACQNALQLKREEAYLYKYAGKSLLALGQFEKAQECLVKAHQLDGSDLEIIKDIGNIFLNVGNQGAAHEWYEKALKINNNYAPAINNIANLKRQSGNTKEAINLFKRAIQADSKFIKAYVGAAASLLAIGNLDQAESFAQQALAINENTRGLNEILGIIFQNRSKPEQAVECYQKELGINPKASNSLLNLGLLLLEKGQAAAAAESLSKASALAPSDQCSLLLAQAYQNLGQFKESIVEYKKLDINNSQNKMIPFNLGLCLLQTGNNNDAIEVLKIAIQLDETFVPAWGNMGIALMNEGRHQEALPATQKVLALAPDNPAAHMNLGQIYKELGQLDQALAATLKSLELKPDNPAAHMNLGQIYKELGQLDQAFSSTTESLRLRSKKSKTTANISTLTSSLGQKLTRQDFIPTFFDNAVMRSLDDDKIWENLDIPKIYEELNDSRENRFITFAERTTRTNGLRLPSALSVTASQGTHSLIKWKNFEIYKSSNDLVIYWMLLNEIKPDLIIELGSGSGGSAIWMSDICKALGLKTEIYSYDLNKPRVKHENVTFIEYDLTKLNRSSCRLPMVDKYKKKRKVIIEDAHIDMKSVLLELDRYLCDGDYLIIEDSGIKQNEILEFTNSRNKKYQADQFYLDFFGTNMGCCIDSIFKIFPD